jgi:hypothetical protein
MTLSMSFKHFVTSILVIQATGLWFLPWQD